MIQQLEEIYQTINISGNTFNTIIDINLNQNNIYTVYEVNHIDSSNTLDSLDNFNNMRLTIKVLGKDTKPIIQRIETLKTLLLTKIWSSIDYITFQNSIPVIYDYDIKMNQITYIFEFRKIN